MDEACRHETTLVSGRHDFVDVVLEVGRCRACNAVVTRLPRGPWQALTLDATGPTSPGPVAITPAPATPAPTNPTPANPTPTSPIQAPGAGATGPDAARPTRPQPCPTT